MTLDLINKLQRKAFMGWGVGEMEVGMGRQVGFQQPRWCPSKAVSRGWESWSQVVSRPSRAQGTLVAKLRDVGRDPVLSPSG